MNPWAGALVVVGAFGVLVVVVRALQVRLRLRGEWARKLVHLGGGLIAMSFPWLFRDWWPVAVGCSLSALALFAMARSRRLAGLHSAIGAIERHSRGEFYFPLAVLIVFLLAQGDALLFVVPVLVLTFADAAAGTVGVRFGRTRFATAGESKTVEGSAACFAVAAICAYLPLALFTDLSTPGCVSVSLLVGFGAAVLEAATTLGLDNLIVPLLVFAILHSALSGDLIMLAAGMALVLAVLIVVMRTGTNAYARRMHIYLTRMLPLPPHAALALLIYASIALFARRVHGLPPPAVPVRDLVGVAGMFLLMLILRLMDELKDEDIDRALFPDRPLPSGLVLRADIAWSLVAVSVLFLALNLWVGWAFIAAAFMLGYAVLMLYRFFAPGALRQSLPLTLATHNPVIGIMLLYGFAVVAATNGLGPADLNWNAVIPFVIMLWSPFLAWELARKIRSPQEEDDYVTYSRILGRSRAVFAVWAVQAVGVGLAIYLSRWLNLDWLYLALIAAGFLASVWAGVRFLRHPDPRTSRLKPFATIFAVCMLLAQVIGFGLE